MRYKERGAPRLGNLKVDMKAFDQLVVTGISPVRLHLGNWALGLYYAFFLLSLIGVMLYINMVLVGRRHFRGGEGASLGPPETGSWPGCCVALSCCVVWAWDRVAPTKSARSDPPTRMPRASCPFVTFRSRCAYATRGSSTVPALRDGCCFLPS